MSGDVAPLSKALGLLSQAIALELVDQIFARDALAIGEELGTLLLSTPELARAAVKAAWQAGDEDDAAELTDAIHALAGRIASAEAQAAADEDAESRCGNVLRYYDDGRPCRRLCGDCSALVDDRGIANADGCGAVLS